MKKIIALLWLGLILSAEAQPTKAFNCEDSSYHRQFDFWMGEWEVTDKPGDKLYGHNLISSRDRGCLLLEEYQSAGGFSGTSMNYYNPGTGMWYQHWVDNGTSIIQTAGGMEGDSMVMSGTIYYLADRRTAQFRGTWTPLPDGRVRQFFEEMDADGEWQEWFDGYYRRVESGAPQP